MLNLGEIKSFLRVSHDADDTYLESLLAFSMSFIAEQTGVEYMVADEVYRQALLLCIAHFYDNRAAVNEKTLVQVPFSLDCLIGHIKMRGAIDGQ